MSPGQAERPVTSGELIAELAARAPRAGASTGAWPGLTVYRFTAPAGPNWEEIQSLSLQFARLLSIAAAQAATNPASAALDYVRAHLSEPLTVADMAEQVSLSTRA